MFTCLLSFFNSFSELIDQSPIGKSIIKYKISQQTPQNKRSQNIHIHEKIFYSINEREISNKHFNKTTGQRFIIQTEQRYNLSTFLTLSPYIFYLFIFLLQWKNLPPKGEVFPKTIRIPKDTKQVYLTAFLRSEPGLNLGTFIAGILIF